MSHFQTLFAADIVSIDAVKQETFNQRLHIGLYGMVGHFATTRLKVVGDALDGSQTAYVV